MDSNSDSNSNSNNKSALENVFDSKESAILFLNWILRANVRKVNKDFNFSLLESSSEEQLIQFMKDTLLDLTLNTKHIAKKKRIAIDNVAFQKLKCKLCDGSPYLTRFPCNEDEYRFTNFSECSNYLINQGKTCFCDN